MPLWHNLIIFWEIRKIEMSLAIYLFISLIQSDTGVKCGKCVVSYVCASVWQPKQL